ncbi:PAS domain S-box protein [Devosia riboflavina]
MPEHLAHRAAATDSDFRKLLDIAPAMIWMATPDGSCTILSRSWASVTGQKAEEGLGDGWLASIYPDDRANVWNNFIQA